jgi:hydrogenase maturation protease
MKRVLVAGIGNVFLGDDGFGVAVAQALAKDPLPEGTRVVDYGIRGLHLAFELLDPPDLLVLVDTTSRQREPGTLYLIDPELEKESLGVATPDAHAMDPVTVFASVLHLGGRLPRARIVGCEPASLDEGMGLSAPVENAIPAAVSMIRELIESESRT